MNSPKHKPLPFLIPSIVIGILTALHPARSENIVFPTDALVVDVTQPPYNADKTGGTDASAAIQQALTDYPNGNRIIYLPNGTYKVSSTLRWGQGPGGWEQKRTILQGQSRDATVIRLTDNAAGFTDPAAPKEVIWTGTAPAQRFRNAIRNLTVHTGSGNAGAIAIRFIANNQGTIRDVKIFSSDGLGKTGLDMSYTNEVGPLLIKNLEITGFQTGISCGSNVDSQTFENITLQGQTVCGFLNSGQVVSIMNLTYSGTATAIINDNGSNGEGVMTLVGATINGSGGASSLDAITNRATLYAEDVVATGYAKVINNLTGSGDDVTTGSVDEFVSYTPQILHPSPRKTLGLDVEDTPDVAWDTDFSQWANVKSYKLAGETNYTAAFQRAIDSGKTTVYFPSLNSATAEYNFSGDVFIRNNVRRIIGCETKMSGTGAFVFQNGTSNTVVFERLDEARSVLIDTGRTVVLRNCGVGGISTTSNATGKLFIEDVVCGSVQLTNSALRVFARQWNVESNNLAAKIDNAGATMWILGLKTERDKIVIRTSNGGKTELLGYFNYSTEGNKVDPMFEVIDAQASFAGVGESNFNGFPYSTILRETRSGVTRNLGKSGCQQRGNGIRLGLLTASPGSPDIAGEILIDNRDATGVTFVGSWPTQTTTAGYIGIDYATDNNQSKGSKSVTFTPTIPSTGEYDVYMRWTSGTNRPTAVPVAIMHAGGTTNKTVNQTANGGIWVLQGRYTFNAGTAGSLTISNTGTTSRFVVADAVRFVRVGPVEIEASADAFVRASTTYANTNFGTTTTLDVKDDPSASYDRRSYIRFDLASRSGPVNSATLSLVVATVQSNVTPATPATLKVYAVPDDTWGETAITWNNRPPYTTFLGSFTITAAGQEVTADVTSFINSELAGDKKVSLIVVQENTNAQFVQFDSREALNKPVLILP